MKADASTRTLQKLSVPGMQSLLPPGDLAVAVARLLAIALDKIQRHHVIAMMSAEFMPDYRSWPMIEAPQWTNVGTVRFYVCSKGVLASDEEFFPVGTQFVMETWGDRRAEVFIMTKYLALYLAEHAAQDREAWMSSRCLVEKAGSTCGRYPLAGGRR